MRLLGSDLGPRCFGSDTSDPWILNIEGEVSECNAMRRFNLEIFLYCIEPT